MRLVRELRTTRDALLDWLYPPRCPSCDEPRRPEEPILCAACAPSLVPVQEPRCPRCGEPGSVGTCAACGQAPPPFVRVVAGYAYGGALAVALRRYKYGGRLDLARPLARLLAPLLPGPGARVIPVPSSVAALRRRGFDALGEVLRLACLGRTPPTRAPVLQRVDRRSPQAGLPAHERRVLPADAFRLGPSPGLGGGDVHLVDDVLTTGATARACSAVLRAGGARSVTVIVLARASAPPTHPRW